MLNNEPSVIFVGKGNGKTMKEVKEELKRASESRVRAMLAIFKLRKNTVSNILKESVEK